MSFQLGSWPLLLIFATFNMYETEKKNFKGTKQNYYFSTCRRPLAEDTEYGGCLLFNVKATHIAEEFIWGMV